MTAAHQRESYLVRDSEGKLLRIDRRGRARQIPEPDPAAGDPARETYAYKYAFGRQDQERLPSEQSLIDLGDAMMAQPRRSRDSPIPAGYTYLGQFIVHDMTFMTSRRAKNRRSPALDLDSVLPERDSSDGPPPVFELLPIGRTTTIGSPLPEDLPRRKTDPERGKPLIADPRNDDSLPLAQCHLALLKFYNAIARSLGFGGWPNTPDETKEFLGAVRKLWVEHFQSVVLHDYLPRVVASDVYADVIANGRRVVRADRSETDWLPIEFAGAVGRFGHSMIRDRYDRWNRHQDGGDTSVHHFIALSYRNSEDGLARFAHALPGQWITNWFRLYDFSSGPYSALAERPMAAARLDTQLAWQLAELPERLREDPSGAEDRIGTFSLARETLKRGRTLNLASAQEAIAIMNRSLADAPIVPLTDDELTGGESAPVREAFARHPVLLRRTPLWYYVLKEADVRCGGSCLGPLGGRIVMETLHAAIEASENSILRTAGWKPTLPCSAGRHFTMPDLIAFGGNPDTLGFLGSAT